MKGILLTILAFALAWILFPVGIIVYLFTPKWKYYDKTKGYFLKVAISIDQMGNVVCGPMFNQILIDSDGYKFGDEDETISSCLGKNKKLGTLSKLGIFLDAILDLLDNNLSIKSIEK